MWTSLGKLRALPGDTRVFCAHEYTQANLAFCYAVEPGNQAVKQRMKQVAKARQQGLPSLPSTLADERAFNVFLRCDQPGIKAAAEMHSLSPCSTEQDVFAALRRWKDHF